MVLFNPIAVSEPKYTSEKYLNLSSYWSLIYTPKKIKKNDYINQKPVKCEIGHLCLSI